MEPRDHENRQPRYSWWQRFNGIEKLDCLIRDVGRSLMARLDPISLALDSVSTGLDGVQTELGQLATQIGALSAGSVTEEEISAVADRATALADRIGGIRTDVDAAIELPGEDDPVVTPPTDPGTGGTEFPPA